jgi:hypothetical protein
MTRTTVTNLKICIAQLLVTEALVIFRAFYVNDPFPNYERIFASISLLTLAPIWALRYGEYAAFLVIVSIDVVFVSIVAFSVVRNHKIVGAVCLLVFNFLGVGFIASQVF